MRFRSLNDIKRRSYAPAMLLTTVVCDSWWEVKVPRSPGGFEPHWWQMRSAWHKNVDITCRFLRIPTDHSDVLLQV